MIVNDVASINIDSKLMRGALVEKDTQLDTVELQNGLFLLFTLRAAMLSISNNHFNSIKR